MANVSSSNGLEKRPKLRFPGFDDPWKAEKLSDFAERVTRKNTNNETSLPLTISSKDGLVDQISYFNKTVASKDMSGYYLLKNGEYAYNKSYSVGYDFGSVKRLDRYDMGALSTLYICFALKKHDSAFIKAYFDSLKWYREIYMISAEGARNHGLLNVPTDEFFDTKHYIPQDLAEQRKIANFMIALERRIVAQQSLVDNLKKYKRGVVKAIMTKQIRFVDKNGKPYPEWSACTLQDAVDFLDGQRKPLESADRAKRQGKYPYYGASGIIDSIDDYIFDEPLILLGEDGANIINRSSPLCFIATGKYWVNNHAHVMRPHKGQNIRFLRELLESLDYTRYNTGTAQPKLNQEKCRTIPLSLPIYEEQCHIADFLAALEHKCAQENEELEGILQTKNALMQQLFI
jgi:type I restriction enzyme S subunit